MLRYKIAASFDTPGGAIKMRSFDSTKEALAWVNENVCVLAPEDQEKFLTDGYLRLPRSGFLTVITYKRPWWAPRAWVEDEWHSLVGAALVTVGVLSIFLPRSHWWSWYPGLWILYVLLLIGGARRRQ